MPNLQSWESRFFITEILGAIFNTIALHTGGWGILTDRCFRPHTGVQTCIPRYSFETWCVIAMYATIVCTVSILIIRIIKRINPHVNIPKRPLILTVLVSIATLLLFSVVIVYPVKANSTFKGYKSDLIHGASLSLSYSYFLAVIAFVLMAVSTIFGYFMIREQTKY
uniref:MARVEL domain-containing protein n=1 Tax=Acrobeloides nanus TaxID=290746 RepID=A0A914E068_9BILA